jgi:NAD dependent epimerase/dehydratase
MKKILITGADGFIGSHLTELLLKENYKVTALSQYNSFNNWGWLETITKQENLNIISGDIRDPHFCNKITKDIDIIFHLAALIAIPYSYIAPDNYIDTNVKGTLNICQAAKENGNIRVIHTSTSEVYGTAKYVPIDEKHPKQSQSPYSASKIGADAIAMSFFHSFNLPLSIARPFNTFGPRQSARAVIPTIITQIANGKKEIILGDTSPTRDFTFVKDTCNALVEISKSEESIGKEINISSNYEISILNCLEQIKEIMNSNVKFIINEERIRPKTSEVYRLWGDNTLLKKTTKYKALYTLKSGLEETCKWFSDKNNLKLYKADIYNL